MLGQLSDILSTMKTWLGYIGAGMTAVLVLVVYLITEQGNRPQEDLTFEDGGIVGSAPIQNEQELWRPETEELQAKNSFGESWEQGIIRDATAATKYKQQDSAEDTQKVTTPVIARSKTEFVEVGDMWKSNRKIELSDWRPSIEEDATKKAIRSFGNAVGTKIQMLTLSHGKQSEKLGSFTQLRDDTGREYIDLLAGDYDTLAKSIDTIQGPSVFSAEQKALANGYRSIADGLRVLKRSTDDASTYENMLTYNTHVEDFAKSFIPFALLFKEQGVIFSENEPGGIFTPPVTQ